MLKRMKWDLLQGGSLYYRRTTWRTIVDLKKRFPLDLTLGARCILLSESYLSRRSLCRIQTIHGDVRSLKPPYNMPITNGLLQTETYFTTLTRMMCRWIRSRSKKHPASDPFRFDFYAKKTRFNWYIETCFFYTFCN